MKVNKKIMTLSVLFFAALMSFAQKKDKPNILFVFADDQAQNTVSALGNNEIKTPNIDKLVDAGTHFTNTYNMGSWSGAVCLASRAMINSGMSVWRAQAAEKSFDERASENQMWGNLMDKAGYETYFTGKWHVHTAAKNTFNNVGTVRAGMPKQTKEGYLRPKDENDTTWRPWDKQFGGFWEGGKHWSEIVGDEAIGFIEDAATKEDPFFMYIAFNAPHDPRQAPKKYVDMYPVEDISLPESYISEHPHKQEIGCYKEIKKGVEVWQRDEHLAPHPRTPYSVKVNRQEYYAIISHMDDQIGRIIKALEESGEADNTYIFYTADHGLAVGSHGLMGKQNLYEHSMKPPMVIVGPDVPANEKRDQLVYLQDVMASTLELAGLERPDYVEFRSMMPLVKRKTKKSSYSSIYGGYLNLQRMVRKDNYKLLVFPEVPTAYLYDLDKDPLEMNNLADKPKYQKIKSELFEELIKLQKEYGDELVLKQETYLQ